jgi:Cu/Zn superoxide dismutase
VALERPEEEFMTRRISAAVMASIAAIGVAGVATADSGHAAKTYRASLAPVNPAATTAGLATVVGKAQLVDGKKNNKVSLHMRNLAAGTMYLWHVHEGSCAATGAPVAGWTYRTQVGANGTLTSNESGNANTKGKSTTFTADPAKSYSVNVHVSALTNGLAAGTIIACGDLTAKAKK